MGVMHDRMHVLADEFLGLPAQHALGRRIDEGGLAVGVDAVDAFAGGAQDQLVLALDVAEEALDPLPFVDAAAHVEIGFRIDGGGGAHEVVQGDQHMRAPSPGTGAADIFELSSLPRGVSRIQPRVQYSPFAITASVNTISAGNWPGCSAVLPCCAAARGHSRAGGRRLDWRRRSDRRGSTTSIGSRAGLECGGIGRLRFLPIFGHFQSSAARSSGRYY